MTVSYSDKRIVPTIIVDEARYLKTDVLNDLKLLILVVMVCYEFLIKVIENYLIIGFQKVLSRPSQLTMARSSHAIATCKKN